MPDNSSRVESVYTWPALLRDGADGDDMQFARWAYLTQEELKPVYEVMRAPLPDSPHDLDQVITEWVDGWAPRVASLSVIAEYFYQSAKERKWPAQIAPDGTKLTVTDREVRFDSAMAPYRLVRDELDQLLKRMSERIRWAQSVRKPQGEAQGAGKASYD